MATSYITHADCLKHEMGAGHPECPDRLIAWQDRVLMVSFFQHPFYPGSGTQDPAPNMINVPLAAGSDGRAARQALQDDWQRQLSAVPPPQAAPLPGTVAAAPRATSRLRPL